MVKLKTLKDITENHIICYGQNSLWWKEENEKRTYIYPEELKQEAIKWIKSDKSNFYSRQGMEETKLWIKNFFNITEEDLK